MRSRGSQDADGDGKPPQTLPARRQGARSWPGHAGDGRPQPRRADPCVAGVQRQGRAVSAIAASPLGSRPCCRVRRVGACPCRTRRWSVAGAAHAAQAATAARADGRDDRRRCRAAGGRAAEPSTPASAEPGRRSRQARGRCARPAPGTRGGRTRTTQAAAPPRLTAAPKPAEIARPQPIKKPRPAPRRSRQGRQPRPRAVGERSRGSSGAAAERHRAPSRRPRAVRRWAAVLKGLGAAPEAIPSRPCRRAPS